MSVGPDGTVYVTEIDEASFLSVEFGTGTKGGTVNACNPNTVPWTCSVLRGGLTIPIATTVGKDGTVYALIKALIPGRRKSSR